MLGTARPDVEARPNKVFLDGVLTTKDIDGQKGYTYAREDKCRPDVFTDYRVNRAVCNAKRLQRRTARPFQPKFGSWREGHGKTSGIHREVWEFHPQGEGSRRPFGRVKSFWSLFLPAKRGSLSTAESR